MPLHQHAQDLFDSEFHCNSTAALFDRHTRRWRSDDPELGLGFAEGPELDCAILSSSGSGGTLESDLTLDCKFVLD